MRPDTAALTRDLNAAKAQWQTQGPASYTYTQQYTGFAPHTPVTVTVHGGVVTAASPADIPSLGTVEDMFFATASSIADTRLAACLEVGAAYDPADGHPVRVDVRIAQRTIADGIGGWRITAFTPQP